MIKDAAEKLAGFSVLGLIHENNAAALMFGIDKIKLEQDKNVTVLFYNMGGMDTEVSIVRYSLYNVTEKKTTPYIDVLAEASDPELGGADIDLSMVNILSEKFNALKERQGKMDVRDNVRAVRRLQKDVIKYKEILSANKAASVKVPELLDYVTLALNLPRDDLETVAQPFFDRVAKPVEDALQKAGLKIEDIDQVELIGGGIRVPKVVEILEDKLNRKDLGVHLNGDEAMCFGSAFIASNSSSSYKVKQVFLTTHPEFDVYLKISPLNPKDALTEDEQKAEGTEEDDIIKYYQTMRLFNTSDYLGKSKGLSMNYNKDMKLELFQMLNGDSTEEGDLKLLETFNVTNVADQVENEVKSLKKEMERLKKQKKKDKKDKKADNSTKEEEKKEEEADEEEVKIPTPKVKISIEFSRSGLLKIVKANAGSMYLESSKHLKPSQLNVDQIKEAKSRLKWYEQRDKDKIKNDKAMNDFESMIYKLRDWLREDENNVYVLEEEREKYIEKLSEHEDWLYEDGATANATVFEKMYRTLNTDYQKYEKRKQEDELRDGFIKNITATMQALDEKVHELKETKDWITEGERQDVTDKIKEIRDWFNEMTEKQATLQKHEDPVMDYDTTFKKLTKVTKLY